MRLLLPPVTTLRNAAQIANEIVAHFKTEFFNSIEGKADSREEFSIIEISRREPLDVV